MSSRRSVSWLLLNFSEYICSLFYISALSQIYGVRFSILLSRRTTSLNSESVQLSRVAIIRPYGANVLVMVLVSRRIRKRHI